MALDQAVTAFPQLQPDAAKPISIVLGDTAEETRTVRLDRTINKPGAVRINVKGAFIVTDGAVSPQPSEEDGAVHDTRDIRLPHHTAVVSHVAIDVGSAAPPRMVMILIIVNL